MKAYKTEPDVYAVQGYDAAQLLIVGLNAVKGDIGEARGARQGDGGGEDRQPARPARAHRRRTTRSRTSTCARSRARRTRSSASRSRTWPTRRAAASSRAASSDNVVRLRAGRRLACPRVFLRAPFARPMDVYSFLIQLLNGLQYGLLLFLVASGPHADLRHHGHHQSRPWQLLHDRRVHGVLAVVAHRQPVRRDRASASCCRSRSASCSNGRSSRTSTSATTWSRCC